MGKESRVLFWLAVISLWASIVVYGIVAVVLIQMSAAARKSCKPAPTIVRFHVYNDDEDIDQGADDLPDQDAQPVPEDSPPAPYSDSSNI